MLTSYHIKGGAYLGRLCEDGCFLGLTGMLLGRRDKRGNLYDTTHTFLANIGDDNCAAFRHFGLVSEGTEIIEAPITAQVDKVTPEERHQKRVELGLLYGAQGRTARWGANHGKTVTVRAYESAAKLLRAKVPERDRASFVTEAILEKLGCGKKEPSASLG